MLCWGPAAAHWTETCSGLLGSGGAAAPHWLTLRHYLRTILVQPANYLPAPRCQWASPQGAARLYRRRVRRRPRCQVALIFGSALLIAPCILGSYLALAHVADMEQ